jgi:ferritin-like metal-binding protein YciE
VKGIIEQGEELIRTDSDLEALEAALIGFAQRVEHYEIAAYGTAWAHAAQLGFIKLVEILRPYP